MPSKPVYLILTMDEKYGLYLVLQCPSSSVINLLAIVYDFMRILIMASTYYWVFNTSDQFQRFVFFFVQLNLKFQWIYTWQQ